MHPGARCVIGHLGTDSKRTQSVYWTLAQAHFRRTAALYTSRSTTDAHRREQAMSEREKHAAEDKFYAITLHMVQAASPVTFLTHNYTQVLK